MGTGIGRGIIIAGALCALVTAFIFLWDISGEKEFGKMTKNMLPGVLISIILAAGMMIYVFYTLSNVFSKLGN